MKNKNDKSIENLQASVLAVVGEDWIPEVCHRRYSDPSEIWCDGNPSSPLFGVSYKLKKTIGGAKTEESERQYWECSKGCNDKAPKEFLYER